MAGAHASSVGVGMADKVLRWHSRWLVGGCLAMGVLAATWFLATHFSFAELAQREQALRQLIRSHPGQAWCLGWVVYFVASLVPGTRGKAIAFGWLFGFWPALLLVNPALTAAAMVTFFASRWIVGDMMPSRYTTALRRVNELLERDGAWYVLLLRVVPVSFSLTNYLLGATRVRATTYWWATQLGLLPGNAVFIFLGARLPSLQQLLDDGLWALLSWDVIAALVLLNAFPFVVHAVVRHWRADVAKTVSVP